MPCSWVSLPVETTGMKSQSGLAIKTAHSYRSSYLELPRVNKNSKHDTNHEERPVENQVHCAVVINYLYARFVSTTGGGIDS